MNQEGYAVFVELFPDFMRVCRKIAKSDWFSEQRWTAFTSFYTRGIFMQIFKPHWFNWELEGIHFELAMNEECLKQKSANLQLHIIHRSVLPDRAQFNGYTIPKFKAEMKDWHTKYEVSETKQSERLNINIPYTKTTFVTRVSDEIGQVCKLGKIIDGALFELWQIKN